MAFKYMLKCDLCENEMRPSYVLQHQILCMQKRTYPIDLIEFEQCTICSIYMLKRKIRRHLTYHESSTPFQDLSFEDRLTHLEGLYECAIKMNEYMELYKLRLSEHFSLLPIDKYRT